MIGNLPEVGGATHIPLKASDGESFGGASAGDAHKVAAPDVAGKQWRSDLWWGDGCYHYDVAKHVVCIVREKLFYWMWSFDHFYGFMCGDS